MRKKRVKHVLVPPGNRAEQNGYGGDLDQLSATDRRDLQHVSVEMGALTSAEGLPLLSHRPTMNHDQRRASCACGFSARATPPRKDARNGQSLGPKRFRTSCVTFDDAPWSELPSSLRRSGPQSPSCSLPSVLRPNGRRRCGARRHAAFVSRAQRVTPCCAARA